LRATAAKRGRPARPQTVFVRLSDRVALGYANGRIIAQFEDGYEVSLGAFSAAATQPASELRTGLPLASLASRGKTAAEIGRLVRQLAAMGLVEYPVRRSRTTDEIVIEPQMAGYWPKAAPLRNADVLALSRFAYLRRRGDDMVLESPRAAALFRIRDHRITAALASLATPQQVGQLRKRGPGIALLALLVDCGILFKVESDDSLRAAEGDRELVLWDFHDLMFHARSTPGRHANPLGGTFPYADVTPSLPAVRPPWPGQKIDLGALTPAQTNSPIARLLRDRHSARTFDRERPITLSELARFLDATARVVTTWKSKIDLGDSSPEVGYAARPYPAGGAGYELELYLAVGQCDELARGFYHYDAGAHALVPIEARTQDLDAVLAEARFAMDAPAAPQIVITIAARFGRITWKYSSLAYALILKDTGVLLQTLYLMATDMGLGGCAIGGTNIDLFARMTGIEFHIEGPVGQFALGRPVANSSG
jgi:SagB-type dehydrogenase family enzyme